MVVTWLKALAVSRHSSSSSREFQDSARPARQATSVNLDMSLRHVSADLWSVMPPPKSPHGAYADQLLWSASRASIADPMIARG